jgi:hypothetical protein
MATYNATPLGSGPAAAAIARGSLVKWDTNGRLAACAVSTTKDVAGVLMEAASAIDQIVRYQVLAGTAEAIVLTDNTAITQGVALYKGASGKVSATSTGSVQVGTAREATGSVDATLITMAPL